MFSGSDQSITVGGDADFSRFLKTGISALANGIDVDYKQLIPKMSEHFTARVLKDSKGKLIVNEPVHNFMHRFVRKARKAGFNRFMILGAFGHGKTEQMCLGYSLYRIAQEPNVLIKIVHVSETEAQARARAIRDYIGRDEDFQRLAPHVTPTAIWGSSRFTVNRTNMAKDSTVEAYGVLSTALGGRANLIIFDDPQDLKTTILEPGTRQKIEDVFKNVWLTRLIPSDGEALVMMNKWHENDLATFIQNNPLWAWCSIAASEDKQHLIYRDSLGAHKILPVWSLFNHQDLVDKNRELGDRDYNRGYRLIPYSDADKAFPSFRSCCQFGIHPHKIIDDERDWIITGGIDISGKNRPGTILTILAAHRTTGLKVPLEIISMRGAKDLVPQIVRTYQEWGTHIYKVENNGVQDSIIDMLESSLGSAKFKRYGIKIEGFLTGRNKADPMTGLPSINKEFEKQEWLWCFPHGEPTTEDDLEKDPWAAAFFEFMHFPFWNTSDIVMATWFAREGAKEILRGSDGPNIW
jgi:hypothetical protein